MVIIPLTAGVLATLEVNTICRKRSETIAYLMSRYKIVTMLNRLLQMQRISLGVHRIMSYKAKASKEESISMCDPAI